MDGIYFVIKGPAGEVWHPPGTSATPHLFASEKKAQARLNTFSKHWYGDHKVVAVQLTEQGTK